MKTVFWNVDTQHDFMRPDGKLYVKDAEKIEGALEKITKLAAKHNIQVINTADWHTSNSAELSNDPDYRLTFPEHCMQGTKGAEYVPATNPEKPYVIEWDQESINEYAVKNTRNIVIHKDDFDVFKGNPYTDKVLDIIKPDVAIVYGVATNVCVNYAVRGLLDRKVKVYVVEDAIKELPGLPIEKITQEWEKKGAESLYTLHGMLAYDVVLYGMDGVSLKRYIEENNKR